MANPRFNHSVPSSPSEGVALRAGDLEAVFWPSRGMLGASLRCGGVELLGRVENLEAAAAKGSTAGIPLLHPWANRLDGVHYRAAGQEVSLDEKSPLLHWDANRLPIHGVGWPLLKWRILEKGENNLSAEFDWSRPDLLTVFPFPHRLEMRIHLSAPGLRLETTLRPTSSQAVPVSFGFHPYFSLPGLPRSQWRLRVPARQQLELDGRGIPTGARWRLPSFDEPLAGLSFDDGFALSEEPSVLSIEGAGRRISVDFLEGYPFAQVYAPPDKDFVALEPMTAPTNALVAGRDLPIVAPGDRYRATFRIRVE